MRYIYRMKGGTVYLGMKKDLYYNWGGERSVPTHPNSYLLDCNGFLRRSQPVYKRGVSPHLSNGGNDCNELGNSRNIRL